MFKKLKALKDKLQFIFNAENDHLFLNNIQVCMLEVLQSQNGESIEGEKLRASLKEKGFTRRPSSMSRTGEKLEKMELLSSYYSAEHINGRAITQKHFAITKKGEETLEQIHARTSQNNNFPQP